jgi:diaminopimelate decarboxylase
MDQFKVVDDCLLVNGIPLPRLAARAGQTPFYAYDRSLLDARVAELRAALPREVSLHYAMKANPMPALVMHMARLVDGIDVASGGELRVALDAGVDVREVSFAGPGKSEAELEQAVAAGILVNVESEREVVLLSEIAARLRLPARVAVRINPDFELKASGMKMGGGPRQFGVDAEVVPALLDEISKRGLAFEGFHLYAGSQNLKAESICEAQVKSYELVLRLAQSAPAPVKVLNLGGGFGIPYFPGEARLDLDPIGANLATIVARAKAEMPQARIVIELGRFLVGEAGVYVCRVVDRKVSRGQVFLVTDGGLHHHLAASGNFGQVIRKNYPACIGNRLVESEREKSNVVGPLCTPLDLLADQLDLAVAEPGDLVVVFQSGAYGATASPQRFLSHPEVVEVLV